MKRAAIIGERITEILILLLLMVILSLSILGIYGPDDLNEISIFFLVVSLLVLFIVLFSKGAINPLMARLGFRNLIRHKGDSLIAIIGFMVGTSIICSSLVIGDTMITLVESLIYENYHNVDEVIFVTETSGNLTIIGGDEASLIEERILSIEDAGDLIDGISFEIDINAGLENQRTDLVEPSATVRAFSWDTLTSFGSLYSSGSPVDEPGKGEIYMTEEAAEVVDASIGDILRLSTGSSTLLLNLTRIIDQTGRANLFGGENLYVSFSTAWTMMNITGEQTPVAVGPGNWNGGYYNTIYISNLGDRVEGVRHSTEVTKSVNSALEDIEIPEGSGTGIEIVFTKKMGVDQAMDGLSTFIKLFVTLGAFSIIAGITLIINIFVMLSEERREEMGISRAIGLRRSHLRSSYLFEGSLYSLLSSLVGVILGILAAFGIIYILENLISSISDFEINILSYFTVLPSTVLLAFSAGFSITLITTWIITQRIGNLNIVSAIKGIPPPKIHTTPQKLIRRLSMSCEAKGGRFLCFIASFLDRLLDRSVTWGLSIFLVSLIITVLSIHYRQLTAMKTSISLFLISAALVSRKFIPRRGSYTMASLLIILIWALELPILNSFDNGLEFFMFSGLFMVTSGVMIVVWNADILLFFITAFFRLLGASPAPVKMAISYPLKKRFRTGVTIFMFALIIFTVTGTSMIVHIFNVNISEFEKSVGGGYDIIGISGAREIEDLQSVLEDTWGLENSTRINWAPTTSLTIGFVEINISLPFDNSFEIPYNICGVNEDFTGFNTYGFNDVDWDLMEERGITGRDDEDVWSALRFPDLVIVDSTIGENQFGPPGLGKKAGNTIKINLENGSIVEKTIVAITDQFAIQAVFTTEEIAASDYNTTLSNLHMIKLNSGADPVRVSEDLRRSLIDYGFITIDVKGLVKDILTFQNSFFDLFNAYLSLGLIIGIVGLGIVTLRSVYERRHEIGMMRAIGFKRWSVLISFLGESTFIASSGIIIGSLMGIILGWNLWIEEVRDDLPEFGIPWSRILLVGGIAITFALISCIPPSRMATKVSPADALRYE